MNEIRIIIPKCCQEGWDTCEHYVGRAKKKEKTNIGL